jgi:hypothetical protein
VLLENSKKKEKKKPKKQKILVRRGDIWSDKAQKGRRTE